MNRQLRNLEVYEERLKEALKKYRTLVKNGNNRSNIFYFEQIVFPILGDYKQALWNEQFYNKQGIYYFKKNDRPYVIYLSKDRSIW